MSNKKKILLEPFHEKRRLLIIGAGSAGNIVLDEVKKNKKHEVMGFVDDDVNITKKKIKGIQVYGPITNLPSILNNFKKKKKEIEEVIIAIPSAEGKIIKEVIRLLFRRVEFVSILPTTYESEHSMKTGEVVASLIRRVEIEDFFRRKPMLLPFEEILKYYSGKKILVTGAAGSIGSEISKQLSLFSPEHLIFLDNSESGIYNLQMEMSSGDLKKTFLLCDLKDYQKVKKTIDYFNPDIIFHAAAYKHVPIVEDNPGESISNNIFGFCNLLKAMNEHVKELVLISTDKAVNPSSVMGISKRICELILQTKSKKTRTKLLAVRFGNVAGSSGSVIPLFKKQLEKGGPITVTHKDMKRFFMTIPEAAQLVLQTPVLGNSGDILALDMGEQYSLLELAKDMAILEGFVPGEDIEIKIVGMREGEKLEEELFNEKEEFSKTRNPRIFLIKTNSVKEEKLKKLLLRLSSFVKIIDKKNLNRLIREEFRKFNIF